MTLSRRVANPLVKAGLGAVIAIFGLVLLSGAATGNPVPIRLACGALAVVAALGLVRVVRAGVVIRRDAFVVHGWTRTRAIGRSQILDVTVVDSRNVTGAAVCVGIHLRDGSLVRALATASYSRTRAARYRDAIAALEQRPPALRGCT